MNAAAVSRVLTLIPERVARTQSGTLFATDASSSKHPERLAHLTRLLSWLTPIEQASKDDQRALGLLSGAARPMPLDDEEDEPGHLAEAEAEAEEEKWEGFYPASVPAA